jgi:hypothetical protein
VRHLLALFLAFALSLSMASGAVAHGMEPIGCMDAAQSTASDGHAAGDADEVPADADKAYPHHHGTCQGHPIGLPGVDVATPSTNVFSGPAPAATPAALVSFEPKAFQRPPLA